MLAKQSTALTVVVGPILDSTGAEYASAVIGDLSISKNGGTLTAMASTATLTYIANGMYTLATTTGNMDTLGAVQVTCNKATYQMPKMERNVVPASVYDAIITNATNATGGLPTATAAITGLAGVISTYAGGAVASVTGSVGSISGVSFPSNFSSMVINGGNGHVAAALHNAQPNSIPEDAFQSGAVSARVIADNAIDGDAMAASANTKIANAVGTLQVLVDMGVMIINDGTADARFSISALQNGPAGEGGAVINVYPVSASTPERVAGTTITYYRNEIRTVSVVTDFTLTSLTLTFTVEDSEGADLLTIANASISRSDKTFTVSIGTAVTATISNYRWALRDITGGSNSVIARGVLTVQEAASA